MTWVGDKRQKRGLLSFFFFIFDYFSLNYKTNKTTTRRTDTAPKKGEGETSRPGRRYDCSKGGRTGRDDETKTPEGWCGDWLDPDRPSPQSMVCCMQSCVQDRMLLRRFNPLPITALETASRTEVTCCCCWPPENPHSPGMTPPLSVYIYSHRESMMRGKERVDWTRSRRQQN